MTPIGLALNRLTGGSQVEPLPSLHGVAYSRAIALAASGSLVIRGPLKRSQDSMYWHSFVYSLH